MVGIKVEDKENPTKAIRRFMRAVEESGVLHLYRENQYFQKPSEKRKNKKKRSQLNQKRRSR